MVWSGSNGEPSGEFEQSRGAGMLEAGSEVEGHIGSPKHQDQRRLILI